MYGANLLRRTHNISGYWLLATGYWVRSAITAELHNIPGQSVKLIAEKVLAIPQAKVCA